jgi:polysaccharide pyruvyl transferase CsaB
MKNETENKRVMIAGYYGANNTGDEAILTGMIHALRSQGITDIMVLSRNPEQTKQIHGVNSLYIGRRFDGLGPIYKQLRKTDLFILGGGGLLQDYTRRVVPYWLSRAILALAARTPVMFYAQGMGPLRTSFARRLVQIIANRVNWITVRDESSLQLLKEIAVNKPPVEVTADPALGIEITSDGRELLKAENIPLESDKIKIGVSLRPWKGEENYLPSLIRSLRRLKEEYDPQFIFFPFQYGEDEKISREVMEAIEEKSTRSAYMVQGTYTPEQMAAMLKEMDSVIAMRLHAIILSAISCVPSFGLVYDPKVFRFMERANLADYHMSIGEMGDQEEEMLQKMAQWLENRKELSQQMKEPVQDMVRRSLRNAEIAREIMTVRNNHMSGVDKYE